MLLENCSAIREIIRFSVGRASSRSSFFQIGSVARKEIIAMSMQQFAPWSKNQIGVKIVAPDRVDLCLHQCFPIFFQAINMYRGPFRTLGRQLMQITEIVIKTIGDLSRQVRALPDTNHRWLFRGHADSRWLLQPGIHRGYSAQQERYLTNEFRVRASGRHASCPMSNDYPAWLALMQRSGRWMPES